MAEFSDTDRIYMQQALALADAMLGKVAPNPAVGCVIVSQNIVIGQGATAIGGRPHAETQALAQAGDKARGATAYVTLEPCAHQGKTPPCADALIEAGIARVVVACTDPDPRVNGRGIEHLRAAGINVEEGLCEVEARNLNEGFFKRVELKRSLVTLKVATSLDGMIATATGESKWITGVEARQEGHRQRARHDAVIVGIATVLADDPLLTARIEGNECQPVRIVLDSQLRLPLTSQLAQSAKDHPVWVFCQTGAHQNQAALEKIGVVVIQCDDVHHLSSVLKIMAERGLTRVLVEGGARVVTSFLKAGCFDTLLWFRAARLIGADGIPAIGAFGLEKLDASLTLKRKQVAVLGADMLEIYEK